MSRQKELRINLKVLFMKIRFTLLVVLTFIFIGCSTDSQDAADLLENPAPEARECEATHPLVGESRDLRVSSTYGISGTVTIISDCEIEISNFFYNGAGPNVSIYGGTNGDFRNGVNLSQPINGRSFQGETISVFLPEGFNLDEINSFSIWCFEFNIDFSSASFE